ncbi:MAG: hypothetical protein QF824_02935 [Candidatus Woesearchaeota archaeon]|jgi:uncharacterized membrane protein|nr:hypothetical protein [Candidatus Woesearchaeota archaeon]MDP7180198.1 hypothetical protein [Candidatus Woesearchaeota archaeon]MDP7458137.1 hypothetical protein [Candidatus Woesearchaeota archaeon]
MNKLATLIWILLLILPVTYAATISGTIYDYSLNKVSDATVEINTQPKQIMIASESTYTFNVPVGQYIIKATQKQDNFIIASVEENLTVIDDGSYNMDLILFPNLDNELFDEPVVDVEEINEKKQPYSLIVGIVIAFLIVIGIVKSLLNKKTSPAKSEIDGDDLSKVLAIIKKEGGRTTQKEIRKQIPLSEGKISLIISQLEHEEKIQKIKKGRGNILVLK